MKQYKLSNGEHFWEEDGWLYFEEGRRMNYFSPQPLATHALDYRYTHGGDIYREACEIVWGEKRIERSGQPVSNEKRKAIKEGRIEKEG